MKYIILFCMMFSVAIAQNDSPAAQLANAERSFSALSGKIGVKESFLQFLSDDCIMFNPNPVNGKEIYRNGPPSTSYLTWFPTFVEVAASGDFGISTGPWEIRKSKNDTPIVVGHYFSVWSKQSDGKWKVIFDNGIRYPKSIKRTEKEYLSDLKLSNHNLLSSEETKKEMMECEDKFINSVKHDGIVKSYSRYGAPNLHVYRSDNFPSSEKKEGIKLVRNDRKHSQFFPQATQIASTGDLGFAYGISVGAKNDSASYIRIWHKKQEWKIVVDMLEVFPK